jgi:hypothetical protein
MFLQLLRICPSHLHPYSASIALKWMVTANFLKAYSFISILLLIDSEIEVYVNFLHSKQTESKKIDFEYSILMIVVKLYYKWNLAWILIGHSDTNWECVSIFYTKARYICILFSLIEIKMEKFSEVYIFQTKLLLIINCFYY